MPKKVIMAIAVNSVTIWYVVPERSKYFELCPVTCRENFLRLLSKVVVYRLDGLETRCGDAGGLALRLITCIVSLCISMGLPVGRGVGFPMSL